MRAAGAAVDASADGCAIKEAVAAPSVKSVSGGCGGKVDGGGVGAP